MTLHISKKLLLTIKNFADFALHKNGIHSIATSAAVLEQSTHANTYADAVGGRFKCTLIPGDGVGPELAKCVERVFEAADVPVDFEKVFLSEVESSKSVSLQEAVDSVKKNKVCLRGVIASGNVSETGELETLNMKFIRALDLFANVIHAKTRPNIKSKHETVNVVVIREHTEGEFSALEHESVPGVMQCLKIITEWKSRRIAKFAFDYAVKTNRKKVTVVHKANIMKLADGLFLKCCKEISNLYPRIKFDEMIVDNCTMQMVAKPTQFDVLVSPNLYGMVMDSIVTGMVGGAGMVPGMQFSKDVAVFQSGCGSFTYAEARDKNIANPTSMLFCGTKMLKLLNLRNHSEMIRNAINNVLASDCKTQDIGGSVGTKEFTDCIIKEIQSLKKGT